MFELVKNVLFAGVGAAFITKEKAEAIVNELVAKGQLSKEEKARKVKELMGKTEEKLREFSSLVETKVKKAVDAAKNSDKKEIDALRQKIATLEKKVQELSGK